MISILISAAIACSNTNWEHSERCNAPVAEFTQTVDGFEGTLTNGIPFTQKWIGSNVMLFRMEDVVWTTDGYKITYLDL